MADPKFESSLRAKSLASAFAGLVVIGLHAALRTHLERLPPVLLFLGCGLLFSGVFGVAAGEPRGLEGERPLWFRVGLAFSAVLGWLVALVLDIELAFH